MGKAKENIGLSEKHIKESEAIEKGLQKVSQKLVAEAKKNDGYLVIAGKDGKVKKIPAKDL